MILVVVVAIALFVFKGSGTPTGPSVDRSATASVVADVTRVPQSVADAVGVPASVTAPKLLGGQPSLTWSGKPAALYIGAEFCPYCAAEMWPMLIAFSRFGSFSGLSMTNSSAYDVHPSTATFSFRDARYTSDLLTFRTVEAAGNDTTGPGTHRPLAQPTAEESALWDTYSSRLGSQGAFPFLDIGNRLVTIGATYDPSVLSGLDQAQIAAKLATPTDPVTQDLVGSANLYTAVICSLTGGNPSAVCNAAGTTAAAKALGL